jgi:hypothetical protein
VPWVNEHQHYRYVQGSKQKIQTQKRENVHRVLSQDFIDVQDHFSSLLAYRDESLVGMVSCPLPLVTLISVDVVAV